MSRGQRIPPPASADVFEAAYGSPVEIEYWLIKENETSFFETELSVDMVLDSNSKVAQFLTLHPWFCQHIVFVWKSTREKKTVNILIESFRAILILGPKTIIEGVRVRPVSNLNACEIIEESRNTIERYDGTKAFELKEKHDERAKKYFDSGLLPRLDI